MRMPDDLAEAFNRQATSELAASAVYLQMSAALDAQDLGGMSAWMRAQSAEERGHALAFVDFVLERGNAVVIGSLPAPEPEYSDAEAVFAAALEQERSVTAAVHDLHRMASDTGDLDSLPFLMSFVTEQVQEEATVEGILGRIRLAGGDPAALLLLDQELGGRSH